MNADSPIPCAAFLASLHAMLDRETVILPAEADAHRVDCAACRADYRAAMTILRSRPSPQPLSAGLTDRIVAAVIADVSTPRPRRQVSRWLALAATAAALLIAVMITVRMRTPKLDQPAGPSPDVATHTPKPAAISVDQQLADASGALASLTRRAVEPTKLLIPTRPDGTGIKVPDPLPGPMEPAAQGLADIRQGAASGLEPVANTARRAFAMFVRELPDKPERKPDF